MREHRADFRFYEELNDFLPEERRKTDIAYRNDYGDREIVAVSVSERRIILTRDRRLLFHRVITHGYFVRSTDPMGQVREVVARLDLRGRIRLFHRCLACNGKVEPVEKAAIEDRLGPLTRRFQDQFTRCVSCDRVYWRGSHYDRLVERLSALLGRPMGTGTAAEGVSGLDKPGRFA
jgi:uncharacterized protein with PIN domain